MQDILHMFSRISFVDVFNTCVFLTFTICYAYQLYFVLVGLVRKVEHPQAKKNHKYAAIISARNESSVIHNLIDSINNQKYPDGLIDVFVIADNCTDNTADIAREHGAFVIERHNKELVGKGYALDYGFNIIFRECLGKKLGGSVCGKDADGVILPPKGRRIVGNCKYEAFFVFDADNVLDKHYFEAMNRVYDMGYTVSTSYRNTKNFDSNWISSGYATWFLREGRFLSQPRTYLNTSCAVSGTGFFVDTKIIEENGG